MSEATTNVESIPSHGQKRKFDLEDEDQFENYQLRQSNLVLDGKNIIYSAVAPGKPDYNLRWAERLTSVFLPASSFTFELIYPPKHVELGFSYQWQYLPFSLTTTSRYLMYCVVKEVSATYSSVIAIGDIILKINEEVTAYKPGDNVDKNSVKTKLNTTLSSSQTASTIRFMRPSSSCNSNLPSVAEILLLVNEKSASARFYVKLMNRGNQFVTVIDPLSIENQLPVAGKKMMQGQKVQWQQIPVLPNFTVHANNVVASNVASSSMPSSTASWPICSPNISVHATSQAEQSFVNRISEGGVYKDRSKFVVIYVDQSKKNSADSVPKIYTLGRYDSEEEATRIYHRAVQSTKISGGFYLKHFLLGYKPAPKQESSVDVVQQ